MNWKSAVAGTLLVYGLQSPLLVPLEIHVYGAAAILPSLFLVRYVTRRLLLPRHPRTVHLLRVLYGVSLLALFLRLNGRYLTAIHPALVGVCLLAPAPVLVLWRSRAFVPVLWCLVGAATLSAVLAYPAAIPLVVLIVVLFRGLIGRGTEGRPSAVSLYLGLAGLFVGTALFVHRTQNPFWRLGELTAQDGVRVLYLFPRYSSDKMFFVAEDCRSRGFYLASWDRGLVFLPAGAEPPTGLLEDGRVFEGNPSETIEQDCGGDRMFAADQTTREFHVFEGGRMSPEHIWTAPAGWEPTTLRFDKAGNRLLGSFDSREGVVALDANDLSRGTVIEQAGGMDLAVDPVRDVLLTTSHSGRMGGVIVTDLGTFKDTGYVPVREHVPSHLPYVVEHLAIDLRRRRFYVDVLSTGHLLAFDLDTHALLNVSYLGAVGLRYMRFDEARNLLYVCNCFDGCLYVVDGETLAVRARVFVGPWQRDVTISPVTGRVLVGSMIGAFEVDIDRVLGEARAQPAYGAAGPSSRARDSWNPPAAEGT